MRWFKILAFTEGISFLLILFVTMPLKYLLSIAEPNQWIGMIHGILFILYVFSALQQKFEQEWSLKVLTLALVAAFLPFGTFYFTSKYLPDSTKSI